MCPLRQGRQLEPDALNELGSCPWLLPTPRLRYWSMKPINYGCGLEVSRVKGTDVGGQAGLGVAAERGLLQGRHLHWQATEMSWHVARMWMTEHGSAR